MTYSKYFKTKLKIGDQIQVKIIEHIDGNDWIVSLSGRLLRVVNTSQKKFREGENIWLKVESLEPPRLVDL